jgi:hypothetical protein
MVRSYDGPEHATREHEVARPIVGGETKGIFAERFASAQRQSSATWLSSSRIDFQSRIPAGVPGRIARECQHRSSPRMLTSALRQALLLRGNEFADRAAYESLWKALYKA